MEEQTLPIQPDRPKGSGGFNVIEFVVVAVIIGLLAAIAVPIYSRYARNARVTEATGRLRDLLTAARSYAMEHESDNRPATADWPAGCDVPGFVGDCTPTGNFAYALSVASGTLTITATGHAGTPMARVTVRLTITDPTTGGAIVIAGL